jgi:hypothetical protein
VVAGLGIIQTAGDLLGDHSAKGNATKGMQQDHTKTPAVKSKPISKPRPKPQTTLQSAF